MFAFQSRDDARGVGERELMKRGVRQHAAPSVEHHHRLRAGLDLRIQVSSTAAALTVSM